MEGPGRIKRALGLAPPLGHGTDFWTLVGLLGLEAASCGCRGTSAAGQRRPGSPGLAPREAPGRAWHGRVTALAGLCPSLNVASGALPSPPPPGSRASRVCEGLWVLLTTLASCAPTSLLSDSSSPFSSPTARPGDAGSGARAMPCLSFSRSGPGPPWRGQVLAAAG